MEPNELVVFVEEQKKSKTINCFDFSKAVKIIRENNIRNARWGLDGDWSATNDYCLRDGKAVTDHDAYLNSTWAIPTLINEDTGAEYPCYTVENKDTWDTRLDWTQEEIDLLNQKGFQSKLI